MTNGLNRYCRKCGEEKPHSEFVKAPNCIYGISHTCKVCDKRDKKIWLTNNSDKYKKAQREGHLKRKYNITTEEFVELLEVNNNLCEICKRDVYSVTTVGPCVDHIKGTKFVRGILCSHCNTAIGLLNHDPVNLHNATRYLLKSEENLKG